MDGNKIRDDLTKELPQWILSAYGPGRAAVIPRQLFGGLPRELSFEELRLRQYELATSGNQQQALQVERDLFRDADEQNKKALRQIDGAISYIMDGANEHPNRLDIANLGTAGGRQRGEVGQQLSNPFTYTNPFQSVQSQNATPFGRPVGFATNGPPAIPDVSMNTPATPAFGNNPFSKGSTSAAFGQVSQAQPSSGFSRPSQPTSALDALGRPVQPTSIFGQPAQPVSASNPFGTPPRPATASNPFQTSQPANSISSTSAQATRPSPFSPFATNINVSLGKVIPNGTANTKLPSSSDTVPPGQSLRSWKGKPVIYKDQEPYFKLSEGTMARIWFPHGPPELANDEGVGKEDDLVLKERYRKAEEMGTFGEGQVPEVAPRMEWVRWDF